MNLPRLSDDGLGISRVSHREHQELERGVLGNIGLFFSAELEFKAIGAGKVRLATINRKRDHEIRKKEIIEMIGSGQFIKRPYT